MCTLRKETKEGERIERDYLWSTNIRACRKCNKKPNIYSVRYQYPNGSERLLGLKAICHICNYQIYREHCVLSSGENPEAVTSHTLVKDWNLDN